MKDFFLSGNNVNELRDIDHGFVIQILFRRQFHSQQWIVSSLIVLARSLIDIESEPVIKFHSSCSLRSHPPWGERLPGVHRYTLRYESSPFFGDVGRRVRPASWVRYGGDGTQPHS